MSLPHAILTSLLEKPCSGAELARRFEKSIGYFWSATHQQIYRELAKLEEAGLVAASDRESTRGRQRHFAVLPAGREGLERWSLQEQAPRPMRDELMVRLRAAAVLGTVDLRGELVRHMALHRAQLDVYREIEHKDFPGVRGGSGHDASTLLQHAVLAAGISFEAAWLAWAEDALAALDRN
ncbi:PadR family transcriptional regulator [Pseudarthrobacter sp. P1]|uniref:PadR family transcriptional regulator n=1 Tax=Pseudarthrobacter sp. P1 TaxID=3418418 RepID=UPI003CF03FA2